MNETQISHLDFFDFVLPERLLAGSVSFDAFH